MIEQSQRTLEDGRTHAVFPLAITPARLSTYDLALPSSSPAAHRSGKFVVAPGTGPLAAFIWKNANVLLMIAVDNPKLCAPAR